LNTAQNHVITIYACQVIEMYSTKWRNNVH